MKPTLFPISLVMLVSSVFADPGDFDGSFGTSGSGAGNTVFAVTVQPDGKILAAGSLQSVNDDAGTVLRKHLVRFNANGSVDRGFGANDKGTNGPVYGLAVQADGKILVGGDFTSVSDASGDYGRRNVARFNADGSVDTGFGSEGHGPAGAVRAVVAVPDGKILVAGDFTSLTDPLGTVNRHRIARLDGDGSIDTTFGSEGKGFDDFVVSIAVQADGKIIAGGNFLNVDDANGSHSRRRFARLESDGSVDSDFGSPDKGVLFGDNVRNVLIQADGKILIAGGFSFIEDSVATHTRRCIARLNSDGSVDTGFGSHDNGVVGFVFGLSQQADGKILAAGQFTSVRDSTGTYGRLRVARFNADGSVDTGFGSDGLGAIWMSMRWRSSRMEESSSVEPLPRSPIR